MSVFLKELWRMLEKFFEAFLILSFGSVAITGQDLQCFVPGECVESSHLGSSGSVGIFYFHTAE